MVSIIRAFARLLALGALTGAAVLLLIASITTPVINTRGFDLVYAAFADGSSLRLGTWGALYTGAQGATVSSGTSFGYNLAVNTLPNYFAPAGTAAPFLVVDKPLSSAFIFIPLAVGANLLALLGALIPLRIVTILTLGIVFLAVGASAIGFTVVIVMVSKATSRLGVLFNPAQFVDARPGWATWFILAALVCDVGALLFLLIAMPPAKAKPLPPADLGVREKYVGTDYGERRRSEAWAGRTMGAGSTGVSKRSHHNENASVYGGYPERDYTSHRSSRRSRRGDDYASSRPRSSRSRRDSEISPSDDDDALTERSERTERRSSRREKRRRRDSDDDDGYRRSSASNTGY